MGEIYVSPGPMYIGPVGGDGPWRELGHTTKGISYTIDDEPIIDMEALRRGLQGGQMATFTFTLDKRARRVMRFMFGVGRRRNRRRNPLHAIRAELRRNHRERSRGR